MTLYEATKDLHQTAKREREAAEWFQAQVCDMLKDRPEYNESLHLLLAAYRKMRAEKET